MKRLLFLLFLSFAAFTLRAQIKPDATHKRTNKAAGDSVIIFSQDHSAAKNDTKPWPIIRYLSISTDILQYAIFQPNVGIEYRRDNIAFGFNLGFVYPEASLQVNPCPTFQYEWPGEVYKGTALRFYGKWYFNPDNQVSYVSAAFNLRFLSYSNVLFTDLLLADSSTMNENAVNVGFDFLYGQEWTPCSFIHIDLFVGLGIHALIRQYTVLTTNIPLQLPLGSGSATVFYPAPVIGFKVGFNLFYKQ